MAQTSFIDYYRILKISSTANNEEIRAAYIRLAKQQHPDKGGSVRAMRRLNQAYETLNDRAAREAYDTHYRQYQAGKPLDSSDDFDIEEVDAFLYEVYQQERRRQWLNPFIMGISIAGLALLLFVLLSVGHMVSSSGSVQAAQARPSQGRGK